MLSFPEFFYRTPALAVSLGYKKKPLPIKVRLYFNQCYFQWFRSDDKVELWSPRKNQSIKVSREKGFCVIQNQDLI